MIKNFGVENSRDPGSGGISFAGVIRCKPNS
jgi:hypothetical protein